MDNMHDLGNMKTKYDRVLNILGKLCFLFIILFAIYGIVFSPDLGLFQEKAHIYDGEWLMENTDGSSSTYKMPMSLPLADGETATLRTVLPTTIEDGMYLAVSTGKSFVMYIEGKEIYTFDNQVSRLPGRITKTVIVPVPLEEDYAGKELAMVITNGKYERSSINSAYLGSMMGIAILLIRNHALQFVMAILLSIAALVTMAIFAYIERRDGRKAPLIYLAEGILAISAWIICDSPLFQLVFGVYFFDGIVGFMLVVTMCLPFLMYFDAISEYRSHKAFLVCETYIVINFIVLTLLHVTNICSYNRVLEYIDLLLVVYIGVIFTNMIRYYASQKDTRHRNVIWGLIGLSVFSFLEIGLTILNAKIPFKVDIGGLFVLAGMIILLFFAILDQVKIFNIMKQETQNAMAATKAKSDFLANMSHEIRTPINAIMGMNQMILRESSEEAVLDYAKDIHSASENLLRIINDILDFSKIESGKLEIICDEYDLGELIYDVTTLVNMKAENKGLKLSIAVDEEMPYKLYGDDKRVREIITNILNNAVKYTEEGFVNLNISGKSQDKLVTLNIVVEDSGQGIKKEDLEKIFSGFSQVNTKKNKNIEGTGLGLSITKRLVELMNGSISVDSEFGKGSTFTVVLPQGIVSDEKMGNYINRRHASSETATAKEVDVEIPDAWILVVDDTPLNLKVISKFLAKSKAKISCATSGERMLELIQENAYDMIFLDHMMPNMDGIEALKEAKKLENSKCVNTPVVALTANAIVGAKEMYLEAGFDDYLSKPVKMEELYEMLIKHLPKEKVSLK